MAETSTAARSAFWDQTYAARGHTGYQDRLRHDYDQPIRLATIDRLLRRIWAHDLHGKRALDIGCGVGDFVGLLRSRGAEVVALDISREVVRAAQRRYAGDDHIEWLTGAVSRAEIPVGAFDVVTSVTVLQHIVSDSELNVSLRRLRNALAPSGRIIALELAPPNVVSKPEKDGDVTYLVERSPSEWRKAFGDAGLAIVHEAVMPQLGIAALRGFNAAVAAMRRRDAASVPSRAANRAASAGQREPATPRGLKHHVFDRLRRLILALTRPFDHWLRLPLPPAAFRHYRIFVLAASDSEPKIKHA